MLIQLALVSQVNQNLSKLGNYLNEFEIQDNVGSKIGCNQPATIGVVGMILGHQNIFMNI